MEKKYCLYLLLSVFVMLLVSCKTEKRETGRKISGIDKSSLIPTNQKNKNDLIIVDNSIKNNIKATDNRDFNIIKNSNMSQSHKDWRLHKCEWTKVDGENAVMFNSPNNEFKKLFQRTNLIPKAGTKITLSAEIKTTAFNEETPYPSTPAWFKPTLYMNFFAEDKKTLLYAPKEKGRGLFIDSTNGKFKQKAITYTVPKGAVMMEVAIKCGPPVQAYIRNISLSVPLTKTQAKSLGLKWKEEKQVIKDKRSIQERAKEWMTDNIMTVATHPVTISVDGDDSDWKNIQYVGKINKVVPKFQTPSSPKDCEGSFKVAVDDNFLYLLIKVEDDKLIFGKNKNYNDDSIEICVSPTFNQNQKYGEMDFQISLTPKSNDSDEFHLSGINYQKYFMPTLKRVAVKNGWGVEIAIPLNNELFVAPIYDMKAIGLNITYNDNDLGEKREHKLSWSKYDTQDTGWKDPTIFGALMIVSDSKKYPELVRPSDSIIFRRGERYNFVHNNPGTFNLIYNPSFEEGDKNWMEWYDRCGYNFSIDDTNAKTGSKSMKIDGTKFSGEEPALLTSHYFDVIPGEKYQIKASVKTDSNTPVKFFTRTKAPNYKLQYCGDTIISKNDGWVDKTFSFIVPDDRTGENNSLDLLLAFKGLAGNTAWIDDVILKHFVPSDFDAKLNFSSDDQCFENGTKESVKLLVENPTNKHLDIKVDFIDAYKGKPILSRKYSATSEKELNIPLITNKNGYIRIKCKISNKKGDFIIRQSDYSVRDKLTGTTLLADMCIAHHIYFDDTADKVIQAAKKIGTKSIRVFIDRTQEYRDGKYNFKTMEPLVNAAKKHGIKFIACVKVWDREMKQPAWNTDTFEKYLRALVKHFKGRVDVWEIGNEPNLTMGWPPKPDAREYEVVLRTAYNVVKEEDLSAKVATAGFNQANLDNYYKTFLDMDKGNFYDVFAFHPYDYVKISAFNESFPKFMAALKSNHPNPKIIDSESGFAAETYQWAAELASKKIPYFLYCGVDAHYEWGFDKSASGYFYAPYASSSPQQPIYTLLNNLYADAKPIGEVKLGDFIGYITQNSKEEFLVIWRNGYDKFKSIEIPVNSNYRVLDVFGNDISNVFPVNNGIVKIQLKNRLPIYLFNIKLDSLKDKIILPPKYEIGKNHVPFVKNILLIPEELRGFFDITIPKNEIITKKIKIKNYSNNSADIKLTTTLPMAQFKPAQFILRAKETKVIELKLKSSQAGKYNIELSGTANNKKLAPLPIVVEVSDALSLFSKGHFAIVGNNSEKEIEGNLSFSSPLFDILPFNIDNFKIKTNSISKIVLKLNPRKNWHGYIVYPANGLAEIFAKFTDSKSKKDINGRLEFSLAKAIPFKDLDFNNPKLFEKLISSQKSILELKSNTNNETTLFNGFFAYDVDNIYIIAELVDSSPNQTNKVGYIGEGDSIIVGIDANDDTNSNEYQKDDLEAGFAIGNDGKIQSYFWDGNFGLEAAKPFKSAKMRILRKNNKVYYNIKIPVSAKLVKGQSIGLSLKITNLTKSGKKTILKFGEGLDKPRDASSFGILNLH